MPDTPETPQEPPTDLPVPQGIEKVSLAGLILIGLVSASKPFTPEWHVSYMCRQELFKRKPKEL